MDIVVMVAQILLSLSILVGLHELGHLIAAKVFGMRVEQYSIGFPPKIFKFKYGETEYALSAIPLGGYVKISGMIDESLDTEKLKEEPKPYEFRSKPAWQRLIVMLGGIIVNVFTGVIIFIIMASYWGDTFVSNDKINDNGGILAYELANDIGLQTGDKIIKINNEPFVDFMDIINPKNLLDDNSNYTILRNGEEKNVAIPNDFIENFSDKNVQFVAFRMPTIIESVAENSLASELGLQKGDRIVKVNDKPVAYIDEVRQILNTRDIDSVSLAISRNGETLSFLDYLAKDSLIGFAVSTSFLEDYQVSKDYNLAQSAKIGTTRAFSVVFLQIKAFGKMFSGDLNVRKSLSGPIGIAQAYGGDWNWQRFWRMTGLLSMVLAFMNLLPIPALDGGHVMFTTAEMISGRKPSDKFLEISQKIGMIILLALMVFIFSNDILKVFGI